jgi:DNA-binding response OmpR family regulator
MPATSHAPVVSILLAEEDPVTRRFLEDNLTADGFRVSRCPACAGGAGVLAEHPECLVQAVSGVN